MNVSVETTASDARGTDVRRSRTLHKDKHVFLNDLPKLEVLVKRSASATCTSTSRCLESCFLGYDPDYAAAYCLPRKDPSDGRKLESVA